MADLGFNVDVEKEAEGFFGEYVILPPGWKTFVIVKSQIKPNSAGTGKLLEFVYQTYDAEKNEVVDRMNIVHTNEVAQRIGRAQLGKLATAIGHKGQLANTDILHGRTFQGKVTVEEFESNKEAGKMLKSNKIADYRPAQATQPKNGGNKAEAKSEVTPW